MSKDKDVGMLFDGFDKAAGTLVVPSLSSVSIHQLDPKLAHISINSCMSSSGAQR